LLLGRGDAQDYYGVTLQHIWLPGWTRHGLAEGLCRIEQTLPRLALAAGGERKRNGLVVRIHEQQDRIPAQRLTPLLAIANEVPRELSPQAARVPGLPGVGAHLLTRGIKPGDVLDVLAINRAPLEELPALKDRLRTAQVQHLAHEIVEGPLLVRQFPGQPGE